MEFEVVTEEKISGEEKVAEKVLPSLEGKAVSIPQDGNATKDEKIIRKEVPVDKEEGKIAEKVVPISKEEGLVDIVVPYVKGETVVEEVAPSTRATIAPVVKEEETVTEEIVTEKVTKKDGSVTPEEKAVEKVVYHL